MNGDFHAFRKQIGFAETDLSSPSNMDKGFAPADGDRSGRPTAETYGAFQLAFDFFNSDLFGGELKPCLITLQRHSKRVAGYYSAQRFTEIGGFAHTDEIAMNPQGFIGRKLEDVLATLVHEQVHLWQFHCGKPSRGRYHNKEWARKMKEIGLYPSSTGAVGGRETGQRITHYIIEGGAFDEACNALLATDFALKWGEAIRFVGENSQDPDKSNRHKYCCAGGCSTAWGKPGLNFICGDCGSKMQREG